jgi:tetratricopeptide (TPR) repeat protein/DNA-binding CsgD family transcriptional regulator
MGGLLSLMPAQRLASGLTTKLGLNYKNNIYLKWYKYQYGEILFRMTQDNNMFRHSAKGLHQISFTERELDILSCIISGRTSRKSIASTFNISTATVASYMRSIMQKLECSSLEYVRMYIESENLVESLRERFNAYICSDTLGFKNKQSIPYINRSSDESQDIHPSQMLTIKTIQLLWQQHAQKLWFVVIIVIAILMLFSVFKVDTHYIRSEFILPETQYLLQRDGIINETKKALLKNKRDNNKLPIVTLVGIGGAGKTTIARMIAQQHKGLTWEINAESKAALIASFRKLAYYSATTREEKERIEFIGRIPSSSEQELQIVLFIKDKVRNHPGWLLIYDNVESVDCVQDYFPFERNVWGTGSVIVTTRNQNLKTGIQIKIPELNQEESLKLFCMTSHGLKKLKEPEKLELSKFIDNLPPYPLDVSIAGHYLSATNFSREEYLRSFYRKQRNLDFKNVLIDEYNYLQTRGDILNLTLTRLLKENPHYLGLLVVISSLDSQNIPIDLCEKFDRPETVQDFIRQLKKASLITVSSKDYDKKQYLVIHRTIQAYIVEWLYTTELVKKQEVSQLVSKLVRLLENKIHNNIRDENYDQQFEIFSHLNKMLLVPELSTKDQSILSAAYECMLIDLEQKSISDLDKIRNHVDQLNIEPNSYRYLLTLSYYGALLRKYGRYKESLSILEKCVDLSYKHYPDSIDYYRALRMLGVTYRVLGRYREAQMCFDSCKKVYQLFPNKNREKAEIIAQLGLMCRDTGKYIEAQKLLKESVDILTKKNSYLMKVLQPYFWLHLIDLELGYYSENRMSFASINRTKSGLLLQVEKHQSRYEGVRAHHLGNQEKALEILESAYKVDLKTGYIENYNSFKGYLPILGKTYIHFKRYKEARNILETCLNYAEHLYGKNKFQNARIICYLGDLDLAEGHLALAESNMEKAYALFKESDHTDMYIPLESLADLYKQKFQNARKVQNLTEQGKSYEKYKKSIIEAHKIIQERFPQGSDHVKRIEKKLKSLK